jgi:hypothetical protein
LEDFSVEDDAARAECGDPAVMSWMPAARPAVPIARFIMSRRVISCGIVSSS